MLQSYIKQDIIEYWTGYYTLFQLKAGSIRWKNYKQVPIPVEYRNSTPNSIVLCVYPTGAPYYDGKPTITLTAVDTYNTADFETLVTQDIPLPKANFKQPVQIEFKYKKGKYVYGSELFFLFCSSPCLIAPVKYCIVDST